MASALIGEKKDTNQNRKFYTKRKERWNIKEKSDFPNYLENLISYKKWRLQFTKDPEEKAKLLGKIDKLIDEAKRFVDL